MVSAGIIDSQSVKAADTVGTPTRGYDAGKRVNGRKRHIVVDTLGLLMVVMVTTASVQDRDGGARILERLRFAMPSVVTVFADGGYAGRLVVYARKVLRLLVEVVRKPADQKGFAVQSGHGGTAHPERLGDGADARPIATHGPDDLEAVPGHDRGPTTGPALPARGLEPALVRSRITLRSNSATAPKM